MINFNKINTFEGGNSKDLTENVEKKNTYSKGLNGRIYSENNVFSFSSIEGTKLVYQNAQIVKWLGYYSFREETIVMAKVLKPTGAGEGVESEVCEQIISSSSGSNTSDVTAGLKITFSDEISSNSSVVESCYTVVTPVSDPTDFEMNYSDITQESQSIDFGEYYEERVNVADFSICPINNNQVPVNNKDYYDAFYSFTLDDNGVLKGERIWIGAQNWPLEGKITCEGVEENEFYKRVYYSDAVNPRRVMNRKDTSLALRNGKEFNQILDNILLQPEIKSIVDGGQLKAMKSMYLYRIISENGQLSEFSPFSFFATIVADDDSITYRGGDISETTGKKVVVKCNLLDPEPSAEIECVALEFEAFGPPTSIRNLGIKPAAPVVTFEHYGNEAEMIDDITINDILEFKNTWSYCNDFTSKKNKLIAAGLRNAPTPTAISDLEFLMPLHSWNAAGDSHVSLMNPQPWLYRFVDPTNTSPLYYIRQRKYEAVASYGPATISLKNKATGATFDITYSELSLEEYTNILPETIEWLLDLYNNDPSFNSIFPNLKIVDNNGQLLFTYIDVNDQTDFSNYILESNNDQFLQNYNNDLVSLNPTVNTSKLVHGAESLGFNQGNGVRISYKEFKEPLLNQATSVYNGTGKLLDYHNPSLETYFMKGEIYRLGFQAYDKSSSRYFSIPLGDVMIPELGDLISSIDNQGNPVITSKKYVNQSVENGVLYGHGIKMHIEVRLDCEIQKHISMYQMLYVERNEDNRTILCQGIGAPLQRVQFDGNDDHKMPDDVLNKWTLPYYGGPVYERDALDQYTLNGENYDYQGTGYKERVITHRGLFYFDSPDLYFNKISDQHISSSKLNVVAKVNTDHTPRVIMERGGFGGFPGEIYPKFSRKILEDQLEGNINTEGLPRRAREDRKEGTWETYFINVSVFAKYTPLVKQEFGIKKAETLNRGEVISGAAFDLTNDVSNNAIAMPCMPWFYSYYQKRSDKQDESASRADMFREATVSPGYKTTIIKTDQDIFTDSFVGPIIHKVDSQIRLGGGPHSVYDTYPIINIYRDNRESVYGGRTQQAYSRNTFISLSRTIPVSKNSGVQSFDVGADTYITLSIRTKNDAGNTEIKEVEFDNGGGGKAKGEITTHRRNGAWNYVTVLESQVEPKLTSGYEFYRNTVDFNFENIRNEVINEAYFSANTLKQFIPKPFKFKDDPNLGNVIAVSNVKLAGEPYDSWTVFKPNNFYAELEKNKGDISNIVRDKEQVYAIQEGQTSLIYIGTDRIINDKDGTPINLKQGSGQVVDGHQVVSSYGTSIRRSVAESDYGFSFFDEKHIEFIKINKPLLISKLLHLEYWNRFKNDRITDCEAFFDHANKETNIRVRTASGQSVFISYNEMFQAFNGEYEYNNDLYIDFDKKIYAPSTDLVKDLHQLNEGSPLNLFGSQKELKLGFLVNADIDKIFQYKNTGIVSSLKYPFKSFYYKSSRGMERTVLGTHNWYKIREGNHTVPAINETNDLSQIGHLRGNWVYVEITAESLEQNKVDILAVNNSLRFSHQ
jgi:hypothetical protein